MNLEAIAHVEFTDGIQRPVYEDERGQFVLDDEGIRVGGVWYIPPEECSKCPPEPLIIRHPGNPE
jgi:hypothetical protein